MPKSFQQTIEFAGIPATELFACYVDPKRHSAFTGAPATIDLKVGGRFTAFGRDGVRGRILALKPGRLIVQTWRGRVWKESDPDSILVLVFRPTRRGAEIHLVHADVPDTAKTVSPRAWRRMYWQPLKAYLSRLRP